ncbi:actin-related protein 2/3 complex subunit 2A-like [Primulina tabacum]|uniref:actin-related protein 2/3 complex subunit 2A-like n=1 Tax=Primulina tabacum TaxID=48773 RepID=UPI003F5A49A1
MKVDFAKHKRALLVKIYSIQEVVLGAPLRAILKRFFLRTARSDLNQLVSLVHRRNEAFFVSPQEFVEARQTPGFSNAPPCLWSPSPPQELQGACSESLSANAGFFSFVILPHHVEERKMDRTVWSLLIFHAYVSYHVKALDHAKPDSEEGAKKSTQTRYFKRLTLKDGQFQLKLRLFADKLQRKRKSLISFGLRIKLLPTVDKSLEYIVHEINFCRLCKDLFITIKVLYIQVLFTNVSKK